MEIHNVEVKTNLLNEITSLKLNVNAFDKLLAQLLIKKIKYVSDFDDEGLLELPRDHLNRL